MYLRLSFVYLFISIYHTCYTCFYLFNSIFRDVNTLIAEFGRQKLIVNGSFFQQFIRFNDVNLCYQNGFMTAAAKCKRFNEHLKPLKAALSDLNLLHFDAEINENYVPDFSSFSNLLHHLRDELFPVCESSRAYKFTIRFQIWDWKGDGAALIESLLQIPQIDRCPNVRIILFGLLNVQLPVEAIAQWLHHQSSDTNRISDPKRREKFLTIELSDVDIPDLLEISGHLTKVFILFYCILKRKTIIIYMVRRRRPSIFIN